MNNFAEENPRYKCMSEITFNNRIWVGKERYDTSELHKLPHDLKKVVGTVSQEDITDIVDVDDVEPEDATLSNVMCPLLTFISIFIYFQLFYHWKNCNKAGHLTLHEAFCNRHNSHHI